QRGLCDLQAIRRSAEVEVLVDAQEVAEVPEADRSRGLGGARAGVQPRIWFLHGTSAWAGASARPTRACPRWTTPWTMDDARRARPIPIRTTIYNRRLYDRLPWRKRGVSGRHLSFVIEQRDRPFG